MLIVFHPADSAAQQLTLSGTVRDVDGVVPEAAVTLIGGGAPPRTATTDNMGNYSFSGLAAGYYELSFAKSGYDVMTRTLTLGPNTGPVDVVFAVGAVSTSVTVTDVAGKATASRLEIPDRDLPVQVSSIPQQLLQQQGVNDMASALKNASGVQTQRLYGVYEQYTIRGFNANDDTIGVEKGPRVLDTVICPRKSNLLDLLPGTVVLPAIDLAIPVSIDLDSNYPGSVHVADRIELPVSVGVVLQRLELPGFHVVRGLDPVSGRWGNVTGSN